MERQIFTIPLVGSAEKFHVRLAGNEYILKIRWNNADDGSWILDIYTQNSEPLVLGIPLIYGADLLAEYRYLGIGGKLFLYSSLTCLVPYYNTLDAFQLCFMPY